METQNPRPTEVKPGAPSSAKYTGINTARQLRVIKALLGGPKSREQVDRIAGASNGPEVIRQLRKKGLVIPCTLTLRADRDGNMCKPGVYSLTEADRLQLHLWQIELPASYGESRIYA